MSQIEFFASLAILVSAIRYGTYFWAIYKKQARPHLFTWFNFGTVTCIGAYAQLQLEGGFSGWILLAIGSICYIIAALAIFVGEKNITRSDWVTFITALLAIPLWITTQNPMAALVLIVLIDALTYFPTFRKSWSDPWGEPPLSYFWAGLRYFLILFTIPEVRFETLFYPFFLMASDWGFMLFLLWRRQVLQAK